MARELSRRGLSTLLVERRDFAWGTTARSTRLIHGGLRYLANYDIGVVREGLRERAWQLRRMPNLVTPLPFILPFYHEPLWHRLRLRAGLTLYDLLSPRRSMPRHRFMSRAAAAAIEPGLSTDRLSEAALYWDAQVELPERLVLDALRAAQAAGTEVRNHAAATGLRRDGERAGRRRRAQRHAGWGLGDGHGRTDHQRHRTVGGRDPGRHGPRGSTAAAPRPGHPHRLSAPRRACRGVRAPR